jgi:small subunit ribosomal protein S2
VAVVTMKQMLEAGVHFGHQTRRWNPKMKRFIFGERNGIYIIDLNQTLQRINVAYAFVRDLVADGGTIMFVGTKKQTQDPVAEFAVACGMPYVNQRWLGGMLTNFQTVAGRVRKLQELESSRSAGDFEAMPKKEALHHQRELEKLERNLGGIRWLTRPPDAIFVIDTKKEHIAVTEANKLHLPVVAVVDTNCDPDVIDYVIPGNDDAIRAGRLMCRVIADAVAEGRFIASRRSVVEAGGPRIGDSLPAGPVPLVGTGLGTASDAADADDVTGDEAPSAPAPGSESAPSPDGAATAEQGRDAADEGVQAQQNGGMTGTDETRTLTEG